MECFLPTEVARLVYGYLVEVGCPDAAKLFLETSQHLKECVMFVAKGRQFNTKVLGLSLIEILDLLTEVTSFVKSVECDTAIKNVGIEELLLQLKLILKLCLTNDDNVSRPVYLRFSVPVSHQSTTNEQIDKSVDEANTRSSTGDSPLPLAEDIVPPLSQNQPHALQVLLENKALHEKLAENINKAVATKSEVDSLERILEKKIVETIVNTTEQDPIFQQMLDELVGPAEVVNTADDAEIEKNDTSTTSQQNVLDVSPHLESQPDSKDPVSQPDKLNSAMRSSGLLSAISTPLYTPLVSPSVTNSSETLTPLQTMKPVNMMKPQPTVGPAPHTPVRLTVPLTSLVPLTAISGTLTPVPSSTVVVQGTTGLTMVTSTSSPSLTTHSTSTPIPTSLSRIQVPRPTILTPVTRVVRSNGRKCGQSSIIRIITSLPQSVPVQVVTTTSKSSVTSFQHPPGDSLSSSSPALKNIKVKSLPPLLPRPVPATPIRIGGARTRGGKRGTFKNFSGCKNTPTIQAVAMSQESVKHIDGSESNVNSNDAAPVTFTVSVLSQDTVTTSQPSPVTMTVTTSSTPIVSSSTSDSTTPASKSESSEQSKVLIAVDATPLQTGEPQAKLHKRLSLSTPRKASHIRALEFETPPKNTKPRRSLSSPKRKDSELGRLPDIMKMAADFKLQSVKRSELFKSPPKKEKRAWDADLRRVYTVEDDIPTSVGLKRKPVCSEKEPLDPIKEDNEDSLVKAQEKNGNSESDEEIMSRIKRDVLDVIGEEDLTNISCASLSTNRSPDRTKISKSPCQSPSKGLEIGDIGISSSTIKKLYSKDPPSSRDENSSTLDSPISKSPKDVSQTKSVKPIPCSGLYTPPQAKLSPDSSTPPTPSSALSIEPLIKECARIETEEALQQQRATESSEKSPVVESSKDVSPINPPKISGIMALKTPAKTTLPIPVEMTPLSKIISEETRIGQCVLLTPTIPPTPDVQQTKNLGFYHPREEQLTTPAKAPEPQPNLKPSPAIHSSVSKKALKASKTPQVRLKVKSKQEPSKARSKSKKKESLEKIDCSELIKQCLQKVKESLYSQSASDSEDSSRLPPKSKTKKLVSSKQLASQKKTGNKKSMKQNPETSLNSSRVSAEGHEQKGLLNSTILKEDEKLSSKSSVVLKSESDGDEVRVIEGENSILRAQLTAIPPSTSQSLQDHTIKLEPIVTDINSPQSVPQAELKEPRASDQKSDLDNYSYSFSLAAGDDKMVDHSLRMSPFFNLFELPGTPSKPTKTTKGGVEVYSSRKRKTTSSVSSSESPSRKRSRSSRDDKDYRRHSRHSSRDRSRGRSPSRISHKEVARSWSTNREQRHRTPMRDTHRQRGHWGPRNWDQGSLPRCFKDRPTARLDKRRPGRSPPHKSHRSTPSSKKSWPTSSRPSKSPNISDGRQSNNKLSSSHSRLKDKHQSTSKSGASISDLKTPRHSHTCELEEGELSDASVCFPSSKETSSSARKNSHSRPTSPVADESKQALLQQVGLDHFLSIVHGSDDKAAS